MVVQRKQIQRKQIQRKRFLPVHAYHNHEWIKASWQTTSENNEVCGIYAKGKCILVKRAKVFPMKYAGRKLPKQATEVYFPRKRLPPFHLPKIEIVESVFTGRNCPGDFWWQCKNIDYDDSLHIFNDNLYQWDTRSTAAGGGNACIRPYRIYQKSIGIPTGSCSGGFQNLSELFHTRGALHNVPSIIDSAIAEIVEVILQRQETGIPVKRLFFCVDPDDKMIGMGIFKIAHDVRVHITNRIQGIQGDLTRAYRMSRK